jgi:hypothetical protein
MIGAQQARAEVYGSTRYAAARAPLPWRIASWLATSCALAVLALVIVHWGWRGFGPVPVASPSPPAPERLAPAIVAAAPFGRGATEPVSPPPAATTLQGETRLLGVLAERDGGGQALFRLGDRGPVLVGVGHSIADGVTLLAVRPDGVRIRDRGVERDLALRPAPMPVPAAPTVRAGQGSTAGRAACLAPPGFKGGVYRLNAELLTGIASRPESWSAFLTPVTGGLAIREQTGLAPLLGMKAGDRMAQANGIALAGVEDVLGAFVKPLIANQSVRVAGTRDGKPAEWLFVNAGACP